MPKFTADPNGSGVRSQFGFSAVGFDTLGSTEYTLVGITADRSGSVYHFSSDEEKAIKAVVEACRTSPRADNLMLRTTTFAGDLREDHGFRLLQDCNSNDYDGILRSGGSTALFDATIDAVDALTRYGKELSDRDFTANAILFVITDGDDVSSKNTVNGVRDAFKQALSTENLESLITILIGVNVANSSMEQYLKDYARDAGFTHYKSLADATPATLAKLAAFISKSISSQSQALGTGGPSQTLPTF